MSILLPWQRVDNFANLFLCTKANHYTWFFRLSATMKQAINPHLLQKALNSILPRFPIFRYRVHRGFFWHTLTLEPKEPQIVPDSASPCMPFHQEIPHLFRVRWQDKVLSVEYHHALTDGMGATVFFRALLSEYLALKGNIFDWKDIAHKTEPPSPEEMEDSLHKLWPRLKNYPHSRNSTKAFQLPFPPLFPGAYRVITGYLSIEHALTEAKKYGLKLNEFLTTILFTAFQDVFESLPSATRNKVKSTLRMAIPVNLRRFFPSRTLRNFFFLCSPEIDLSLGHYTFEELAHQVHHQLKLEMNEKELLQQIARNLYGVFHPVARFSPLLIKKWVLRSFFMQNEHSYTSSLSNLGLIDLPSEFASEIESISFIPPPSPLPKLKIGVISWNGILSISIASRSKQTDVEKSFFTQLRTRGFSVKTESNSENLKEP